jgi:dTDP-4-amino-4,6-dideoxygalactose transaminase
MRQVPMLDLRREYEYMKTDIESAITQCLEHQKWILGPEVQELEKRIAEYLGVKNCVGISSGTDALVLSLRALAIQNKKIEYFDRTDEIITTPLTFTATGDAILRAGATPVFVDINPITYNIDHVKINEYIKSHGTQSSSIVGIIPVHLYGLACNMDEIMEIAKEYNLFILEDVAQAFGGMWKGEKLGSIGTIGAFSFFPSKNLGGFGDGGMVATNDDGLAELVRMLLKHGGKDKYNVSHIGYNARLDTLQAAIILSKFQYVIDFAERRQKIAEMYSRELIETEGLVLPVTPNASINLTQIPPNWNHVYHQYTVRVLKGKRNKLISYLREKGISTMIYYPVPLDKMEVFKTRSIVPNKLNYAEKTVDEVLSLPIEPLMTEEEVMFVTETIKSFFKE